VAQSHNDASFLAVKAKIKTVKMLYGFNFNSPFYFSTKTEMLLNRVIFHEGKITQLAG